MFTLIYMAWSMWGKGDGVPLFFVLAVMIDVSLIEKLINRL